MSETRDPAARVYYLYAIYRREETAPDLPDAPSGAGGVPLQAIVEGDLAALAAILPADAWSRETVEANLGDQAWVEREVQAHEAVVEACMAARDILPCKFLTLFSSAAAVRAMLAEGADRLRRILRRVAGCREWSVKLLADVAALREDCLAGGEMAALRARLAGASSGQAFFFRKKLERDLEDLLERRLEQVSAQVQARLRGFVPDGVLIAAVYQLAPERRMLFNLALLVPVERQAELEFLVESLRAAIRPGFSLSCTGPWPPYHSAGAGGSDE